MATWQLWVSKDKARRSWPSTVTRPLQKLRSLGRARRLYRNWLAFAAFRVRLRELDCLMLREGPVLPFSSPSERAALADNESWNLAVLQARCGPLRQQDGTLEFSYRRRRVQFTFGSVPRYHGILREQFADEQYRWLDPAERDVLDVGGCIGDSAVYFALNGARSVLVVEPFPRSYQLVCDNVKKNRLSAVITPLLAGAGADGTLSVSVEASSDGAILRQSEDGQVIPVYSLARLLEHGGREWRRGVAKIDCEGGEYELIRGASRGDLRTFERYIVEYHFGLQDLPERLSSAGFRVWFTAPVSYFNAPEGATYAGGLLRAQRRSAAP